MKHLLENWRQYLSENKNAKPLFQKAKIKPYIDLALFLEGGNVFAGETAGIPREFIGPTLEEYYKEMNRLFPGKNATFLSFRPLGSVGKKDVSGDIDLAGDVKDFFPTGDITPEGLKSWKVDPASWEKTFQRFKSRARSRTDAELGWRAFLYELATYINDKSEIVRTDIKKVGPGVMFSLFPQFNEEGERQDVGVQIDWMIGTAEWLEFAYYSDPPSADDPLLKGLHRTQLMLAMFLVNDISYHHTSGLKDRKTRKFITNSPPKVLSILGKLYDGELERSQTNNFHSLHQWLKVHTNDQEYADVIGAYIKILDTTKSINVKDPKTGEVKACGYIPRELEDFWIANQEELKLKGRYICRETNEKIWNYINGQ